LLLGNRPARISTEEENECYIAMLYGFSSRVERGEKVSPDDARFFDLVRLLI
jgi:hypothetical protein